jgi:hypothetical protein
MKLSYLLLCASNPEKIIKNINLLCCKNCVFYKPNSVEFASSLGKCHKFGEKNIITDEINFPYVDSCRYDETKCGKNGVYYIEEKNIFFKHLKHHIIYYYPISLPIFILAINLFTKILFNR